ncbi:IS3 family transposase [Cellvibrio sp. OA-2007]|uniref:IS3 family transposase n=1 Tax=Cellvibrio sp. OA-2007 TaxID=529823 RepID=UPI0035CF9900
MDKYHSIKQLIRQFYERHKGRNGYRRIAVTLRKRENLINHKTVQRLMHSWV